MGQWCPVPAAEKETNGLGRSSFRRSYITFEFYFFHSIVFSSVQLLSRVWLFATPWIAARQASLSITNFRTSLRLTSIESVMPSSHLILCRPLLLLPPIPPSIRVFSSESALLMRWPKYWSFSFSTIPSKEIPGLISFRMDWLDLLAVQGTLKSLLQHHSSKASILLLRWSHFSYSSICKCGISQWLIFKYWNNFASLDKAHLIMMYDPFNV